jgi:hypothetical protein
MRKDLEGLNEIITTNQFAELLSIQAKSIRHTLCRCGSYHGVRPVKLPNRRLAWRVEDVRRFLEGVQP